MRRTLQTLREQMGSSFMNGPEASEWPLRPLSVATAQILLATGMNATVERLMAGERQSERPPKLPWPLAWAPSIVGTLAAAAHLLPSRGRPDHGRAAIRLLDGSALAVGATLVLLDLATSERPRSRLAPLGLAAAGALGLLLVRQEAELFRRDLRLRRKARLLDRLIPPRRAKLDRIVVHV